MTLTEYLTDECRTLFLEAEDFRDAMQYLVEEDIELEAIRILKSFYEAPGKTPTTFQEFEDGPGEGEAQTFDP